MDPKPDVYSYADLVQYQDGAVVSRAQINKTAGSVTFFAFGAGETLSEHTAPYDALAMIIDGQAEITVAGQTVTVAAGHMLLLPANKPHALRAVVRFKMILTMIREA